MISEAQIQEDLKGAMKARDMEKVYVLRSLIAAIKNVKVDKRVDTLAEAEISALVRKEIAKRTEAADFARKANRADLADKNEKEKALLENYLPQQMSAAVLEETIRRISKDLGTTQIGPVMAKLKEDHAGLYDGKLASQIVRKLG
jgi:uncharacterized protein YqeY